MENKKKPSVLRLVASHNDFESEEILFKPEMLKWPFFTLNIQEREKEKEIEDNLYYLAICRRAIEALTHIYPFEAKIALGIDVELQRLYFCHRTWAKIYLNGQCVLTFSHYTTDNMAPFRNLNDLFRSILDWPEIDPDSEEYLGICAESCFDKINMILSHWTVEQWTYFFTDRLFAKANALAAKADAKMNDAKVLHVRVFDLMHALFPK